MVQRDRLARPVLPDRVAEVVVLALETQLCILLHSVEEVEVANGVFCNVELFWVRFLLVLANATLQHFSIDQKQLLREERQIAGHD